MSRMGGMNDPYGGYDGYGGAAPPPKQASILNSQEEIDEFLAADGQDAAVLGYFETPAYEDDLDAFKEVSKKMEHMYRFAYTTNEEVIENSKFKGFAVYIYKPANMISEKYDEKLKNRFPGSSIKAESLGRFIEDKALPLVGYKVPETRQRYEHTDVPEFTLFTDIDVERNMKMFQYYANRLRKVAKDSIGTINFNIADRTLFSDYMHDAYGLESATAKKTPLYGIRKENVFFVPIEDNKFSTEAVRSFIADFLAGKIEGKEMQDPRDEEDMEPAYSAVIPLTGENFESIVYDDDAKDVMVEFYAPWCGHCKALKPEYEKLAQEYHVEGSTVVIAALDADTHSVPEGFDVQGFPTIMFLPAAVGGNRPTPIPYEGQRTAAAMSAFIKENAVSLKK